MKTSDRNCWQDEIDEELKSMKKNNVWKLVDRPTTDMEEWQMSLTPGGFLRGKIKTTEI